VPGDDKVQHLVVETLVLIIVSLQSDSKQDFTEILRLPEPLYLPRLLARDLARVNLSQADARQSDQLIRRHGDDLGTLACILRDLMIIL
jgi:hypothetical protein